MTGQGFAPSAGGVGGAGGLGGAGGRNARFTRCRLLGNRLTLIREAPANAGRSGTNNPSAAARYFLKPISIPGMYPAATAFPRVCAGFVSLTVARREFR